MKNPSTISSGESDERAAFEASYRLIHPAVNIKTIFERVDDEDDRYALLRVQGAWEGWQARAALATQPAESKACASVGVEPISTWNNDKQSALNDWFLSLPEGRRNVLLKGDRWALAGAAFEAALASPAPSVGEPISVGDSLFEGWFQSYRSDLSAVKQVARDAYAAGMSDPLAGQADKWRGVYEAAIESFAAVEQFAASQQTLPADMAAILDANKWDLYASATPPAAPAATEAPSDEQFHAAWDEWSPNDAASFDDFQAGWVKALRALAAPAPAVGASPEPSPALKVAIDALEILNRRPRPMCRDCADEDGTCPGSGLPCDMVATIRNARNALAAVGASVQPVLASLSDEPDRSGVYAWVTPDGHASLVLVGKRPTPHCEGGKLNAVVIESSKFYDGCAVEQWGKHGRWVLLHDFAAALASSTPTKGGEAS